MQSGYGGGGVSEIQQFMVDGCASSLFSISTQPPNPAAAPIPDIHTAASQHHKFHPFHHPHHHHHHQPPQFSHFHPIPITQQLFHHPHHQFQLFHQQQQQQQQQQLGLDQESGPENSTSPTRMMGGGGGGGGGGPAFLSESMNFKLAVNESSGGGSRDGLNEDDGILHGDDGSESRLHPWHREQESSIKEPFWRPLDIDYINPNNKRCKDKQLPAEISSSKYCKKSKEVAVTDRQQGNTTSGSNYKLFSELEAIYKPGATILKFGGSGGGGGGGNNQTGSGSALTGDETPFLTAAAPGPPAVDQRTDHGSDNSTGGEAPLLKKFHKGSSGGGGGRRKRKRRQQQQNLTSIAAFFETLVKPLMDHQEDLHRKFIEVMEKRDQERSSREEAWRKQEAANSASEAAARAEERALAAAREAAIISFLEKITGESLNLPTINPQFQPESQKEDELYHNAFNNNNNVDKVQLSHSRWPKAVVQALIQVRSGLESRFQEPGLKGPLWEEVSSLMGSIGYNRSAKRCKEKWENINKYFRKTKDSGKKRPQHSKTCPYFHQLDQLYSKSKSMYNNPPIPPPSSSPNANLLAEERKDNTNNNNSELLDAIVPLRFEFSGKEDGGSDQAATDNVENNNEEDEDEDEDEEG